MKKMSLSGVGPEEENHFLTRVRGRKCLGRTIVMIEKNSFDIISDIVKGIHRVHMVGEKGFRVIAKVITKCYKAKDDDTFVRSWLDEGWKVTLVRRQNKAGFFSICFNSRYDAKNL